MAAALIDYRSTGIAVRGDIVVSQTRAWQSLAAPGAWWTGPERVAIAREVRAARRCAWCADRKRALSPYAVNGSHDAASDLRPAVVDAVHRVVTDPGRLTRHWADEVIASGVSDAPLVELVSIVCAVMLVDGFARAIGAELPALPEPLGGEPTRARPPEAVAEGYFVPTIPYAIGSRPEHVAGDPAPARRRLIEAAGPGIVVEAGAVLGMFHWNDRVADATGAPLDEFHLDYRPKLGQKMGLDAGGR